MEEIVKNAPESSNRRTRTSPLMKLFAPNPIVNGAEVDLRKIRDLIYSYAWSRERRDDQKLDFVVSQWGVNRNVPERFFPDTPYGTSAFQNPEKLRCNLHLVNREISADFRRFVYSANDLEIDINLKPNPTTQAETELQKVVDLLQNPNFLKYTQIVRVRIHFPSKYPTNDLPWFNHRVLDNIARTLDEFRQLRYLTVRVVPAQEQSLDYELRSVAFPFYTMRMTRWSIRVYNPITRKWDLVEGEQVQALDQAWELYQKTGSLSIVKRDGLTVKTTSSKDNSPCPVTNLAGTSNMNGSQKRKHRKRKTAHTVLDLNGPLEKDSNALYVPAPTPAEPDSPTQVTGPLCASSSAPPTSSTELPLAEDSTSGGNHSRIATNMPAVKHENMPAAPPSPPVSPTKPCVSHQISSNSPSTDTSTGEVILTPSESLADDNASLHSHTSNNTKCNQQTLETFRPSSPPLISNACDANDETCGSPQRNRTHEEQRQANDASTTEASERKGTQRSKKNKRKSKKPKQSKAMSAPEPDQTADGGMASFRETDGKSLATANESKITIKIDGLPDVTTDSSNVTLVSDLSSHATTIISTEEGDYQIYNLNHDQTRTENLLQRLQLQVRTRQQIEMRNRQNERRRHAAALLEVQKKETRDKRAVKKAKALRLRRENVATDSPLSRITAPRRESKPKDALKRGAISKSADNMLPAEWDNINTRVTERSEHRDWSTTETDASILEDRPYRFNLGSAIDRNVEEVVEDDPDENHDERVSPLSGNYVHHAHRVEDGRTDKTFDVPLNQDVEAAHNLNMPNFKSTEPNLDAEGSPSDVLIDCHRRAEYRHHAAEHSATSILKRFGQQVMASAERRLTHPPGISVPQENDPERAGDVGDRPLSEIEAREPRNNWITTAAATDDERHAQRKEVQARLEAQMEASGTKYSDYDNPIRDSWTKTDKDGNCLEKGGEDIVYDRHT